MLSFIKNSFFGLLVLATIHPLSAGSSDESEPSEGGTTTATVQKNSPRTKGRGAPRTKGSTKEDVAPEKPKNSRKKERGSLKKNTLTQLFLSRRGGNRRMGQELFLFQANVNHQSGQIEQLEELFFRGPSAGIIFRNAQKERKLFFSALRTLYNFESDFLSLNLSGGRHSGTIEAHTSLLNRLPEFIEAYKKFPQSLGIIFEDARNNLDIILGYISKFTEDFKTGKSETSTVDKSGEEKERAEKRPYGIPQVRGMIRQIYTQYYFFSEVLPLLKLMYETQVLIGPHIDFFIPKKPYKKSRKEFQGIRSQQLGQQENLLETFSSLLTEHTAVTGTLNSILLAHETKPLPYEPRFIRAEFYCKQSARILGDSLQEHYEEDEGYPFLQETCTALVNAQDKMFNELRTFATVPDLYVGNKRVEKSRKFDEKVTRQAIPRRRSSVRDLLSLNLHSIKNNGAQKPLSPRRKKSRRQIRKNSSES